MSIRFANGSQEHLTPETIELIRNSVACAVVLLERRERIRFLERVLAEQTTMTRKRFSDLSQLGRQLTGTLDRATTETRHLSRVSDRIREAASGEVAVEVRRVREAFESGRTTTRAEIDSLEREWRGFVDEFLLNNVMPGSRGRIRIRLNDDDEYEAVLRVDNDADLAAIFRLDIPYTSRLAAAVRVRDLVDDLRVGVPHRGWLFGDRVSTRRLGRYWITRVVYTGDATMVSLRAGARRDVGFDLRFSEGGDGVRVRAVGEGDPKLPEHLVTGSEAEHLRELEDVLVGALVPLAEARAQTLAVRVAGTRLDEACADDIAQRIVGSIGALMRGVRRALQHERGGLIDMIERLPPKLQARFEPLGLVPIALPPPPVPHVVTKRPDSFSDIARRWQRPPSAS